jgi:NADP-dependent 3-hydroxy acid dehydrogenase YdfG
MMAAARRELDGLEVLVNNAGGVVAPVYPEANPDHWVRMLDLNLRGVMRCSIGQLAGLATVHVLELSAGSVVE